MGTLAAVVWLAVAGMAAVLVAFAPWMVDAMLACVVAIAWCRRLDQAEDEIGSA